MPLKFRSTPKDAAEDAAYRIWQPWLQSLTLESHGNEYAYGDYLYIAVKAHEAKRELYVKSETYKRLMNSECLACQEAARRAIYPPHIPAVAGHVPHCSCNACW